MPAVRSIVTALLGILIACSPDCRRDAAAQATDVLTQLRGKAITIAMIDEQYPPFHTRGSDGRIQGFDPDIALALCERMQAKCSFVAVPFEQTLPLLMARKFDAVFSLEITDERAALVGFTAPYQRPPAALLTLKGAGLVASSQGLFGRTVAVERLCPSMEDGRAAFLRAKFGDQLSVKAYDAIASCPKDGHISYAEYRPTLPDQLRDLAAGRIDAVFSDKLSLYYSVVMTPEGSQYEFARGDLFDYSRGLGIAVPKNDRDLLAALDAALTVIVQDGTYQKIQSRHFPFDMYGLQ
jgi:ABC-type amino acid transport substrate-binding protein